jgi:hypothetical protein
MMKPYYNVGSYRPYKRASNFRVSSSHELTQHQCEISHSHMRLNGSISLLLTTRSH